MMKSALRFLVLFAVSGLVLADYYFDDDWAKFKTRHNKNYKFREDFLRKDIYRLELNKIKKHNVDFATYHVAYPLRDNYTSDLTDNETRNYMGLPVVNLPDAEWLAYKKKYNTFYNAQDDPLRQSIYRKNIQMMTQHNQDYADGKVTWNYTDFFSRRPEYTAEEYFQTKWRSV